MDRSLAAAGLLVGALLLSGCLQGMWYSVADQVPQARDTIVLTFTLHDLGNGTEREAGVGQHCRDAYWEGDRLRLERRRLDRLPDHAPLVLVEPQLEGPWTTLGTGAWFDALPGAVNITIERQHVTLAHVGHDREGTRIDGVAVDLPHRWSLAAPDGTWRIDAQLRDGPDEHKRFTRSNCA